MSFQGSLKELHLPDVIQLVSVSGKSGSFRLERKGDEGFIYLENGTIVHATLGKLPGEEAIYALATWNDGTFRFIPGDAPPEPHHHQEQHQPPHGGRPPHRRVARALQAHPLARPVPRFQVPEGKQGQINLNTQEWLILSKINGKASIEQIADSLGMSTFEVAKLLYGLVTMGLIVLDEPPPKAATARRGGGLAAHGARTLGQRDQELMRLVQRLREEAESTMGETAWPMILRAYRQAKADLEAGGGTEAIQRMCQEILGNAVHMEGPETQRHLAERFRDILSTWNAGARETERDLGTGTRGLGAPIGVTLARVCFHLFLVTVAQSPSHRQPIT